MPNFLPITIYPEPILLKRARKVKIAELKSKEIQQLILDMGRTMKEKDGIGLAAPQVGQSLRLIVINTEAGNLVLVNPKFLYKSLKKEIGEEGCLSLPGIFGLIKRSVKVRVSGLDKNGKKVRFTASGFFARVLQHEVDHINGKVIISRLKKVTQGQEQLDKLLEKK